MKCPNCGHECITSTCPVCGTKLDRKPQYLRKPSTSVVNRSTSPAEPFRATKTIANRLRIDENNKKFSVNNDIFSYGNLLNFELIEESGSEKRNVAKRTAAGWALLGAAGAVVGGLTAKTAKFCTSMYIRITLRNHYKNYVDIYFLSGQTDVGSDIYENARKNALNCLTALQKIEDANEQQESEKADVAEDQPAPAPFSAADEILKFKNLADAGIITQEEFEAKKKQLLGL